MDAAQAAIRAGYSAKTATVQGAQLLAKLSISTAVQQAMDARAKRTEITADNVLKQLGKMCFFDVRTLTDHDLRTQCESLVVTRPSLRGACACGRSR